MNALYYGDNLHVFREKSVDLNRLLELYRVLKPTGSLYLHYDTAAA